MTTQEASIIEEEIMSNGFVLNKHYEHDEWETIRFVKGCIQIEFTYTLGLEEIHSVDATIDEAIGVPVGLAEIISLDRILNKQ